MARTKLRILKIGAIVNTLILALVAYLTVIMYKVDIGTFENIAKWIIFSSLIVSVSAKLFKNSTTNLIVSLFFDLILIVFLYNPTDYTTLRDFLYSFLDIESHIVVILYVYLFIYYYLLIKKTNNT